MGVWPKKIKHKDGTVREMWYGTIYHPVLDKQGSPLRYENGKAKYKPERFSLGRDTTELTPEEAEEAYDNIVRQIEEDAKREEENKEKFTLFNYNDEFLHYLRDIKGNTSWKRNESALQNVNEYFLDYFGHDPVFEEIDIQDCEKYQDYRLKQGISPRTINIEMGTLRHMYNTASTRGRGQDKLYKGHNPVLGLYFLDEDNKESGEVIDEEVIEYLMSIASQNMQDAIFLARYTTMRRIELIERLRVCDLYFENDLIAARSRKGIKQRVRGRVHDSGKNRTKVRYLPMISIVKERLKEMIAKNNYKDPEDLIILNTLNRPYGDAVMFGKAFDRLQKNSPYPKVKFHNIRHTGETLMLEDDKVKEAVMDIMGHRRLDTTNRYSHPGPSKIDAMNSLTNRAKAKNRHTNRHSDNKGDSSKTPKPDAKD